MKLEELARQSSDAARAAVVHLDPPALGGARNRGRMPLLAGAAAVLLALVSIGVFWSLRDDPAETVTAGSGELPVLGIADPASFGLRVAGVFDPDTASAEQLGELGNDDVTFAYFGTPGADDPYTGGDLIVGELRNGEDPITLSEGEPVTVRGGIAASATGPVSETGLPGASSVEWIESTDAGDVQYVLASRSLDVDTLIAVADALDLSGGLAQVTLDGDAMPEAARGLETVDVEDGFPSIFAGFRGGADSTIVGYQRLETISSDIVEQVTVTARSGSIDDGLLADRWWSTSAEQVEVAGEPAWLLTYVFDDSADEASVQYRSYTVTWQWEPGVMASTTLTTAGDPGLALDLAAAVVELDPASVDGIEQQGLEGRSTEDFDEVWGSGTGDSTLSEGSTVPWSWAVGIQDGEFCSALSSGQGGFSSCQPLSSLLDLVGQAPAVVDQGALIPDGMDDAAGVEFGVIVAGASDVVVPSGDTPGEFAEVVLPNDADGTRLLVWVGPADGPARFDVVVDGDVVATLDLADGAPAIEAEALPVDGDAAANFAPADEAEAAPTVDVAANPSAQSLGIADDFVTEATGETAGIAWAIGTSDDDWYLVTEGDAVLAAGLTPDGANVLRPYESADGEVRSLVVTHGLPSCAQIVSMSVDPIAETLAALADGTLVTVAVVRGEAQGWTMQLGSVDRDAVIGGVDLPDIEGSVPWPEALCGEDATAATGLPTLARARSLLDGLGLDDANAVAADNGWELRVTTLDGDPQYMELDDDPNRVNVSVSGGEVSVESIG